MVGGTTRVSIYHTYTYQNRMYYRYVPTVYYSPAFYAWINTPWQAPVYLTWGNPAWRTYYRPYFTPYPAYTTADLWLTDYVLSVNLQRAYAEQQAAAAGSRLL